MKLSQLFADILTLSENQDVLIKGLSSDTRQIRDGFVFFCLNGFSSDGHEYAHKALEQGAVAIVAERDLGITNQIIVPDTHKAYALCCGNFFGNPQKKLKMIGVTGTNGKTTVTYLIHDLLKALGHKAGLIGTVTTDVGEHSSPAKYTTPDPYTFYNLLWQMVESGCEYAVMEVSSHGLDQKRVAGCQFEVGVFTNLTQDHLDYHHTMEEYFQAKAKLFNQCKKAIISIDDDYGQRLAKEVSCPVKTFSIKHDSGDYAAKNIALTANNSKFIFVGNSIISRVIFPVPGNFSVSNAMAALSVLVELGFSIDDAALHIKTSAGVPGRFEVLPSPSNYTIIRDYAHTPDAIVKVVKTLKQVSSNRVVILFGCAGSRDRTKRPDMAKAASLADFVVLTSDNPRHEEPQQIIDDALPGFVGQKTPYKVIVDRYEAIKWVLENAKDKDTILLAGKGHEDYQVLDTSTIHFDEREIVSELLMKIKPLEE